MRQKAMVIMGGSRALRSIVMAWLVWTVVFFMGSRVGVAQPVPDQAVLDALTAVREGKLLRAISLLESRGSDEFQLLGLFRSFVGETEKGDGKPSPSARQFEIALREGCHLHDACDEIVRLANGKQIVILNEAHDVPQHRWFIAKVLKRLRSIGFTYYAFETLGEEEKSLIQRGYPVRETGFYSQEPRFGELIRDALRSGFVPVRYEAEGIVPSGDTVVDINRREEGQCENLMERLFRKDPKARVVIHVGHDHVMEQPRDMGDGQLRWMAARLKEATGMDPLTIDQVTRLTVFPESRDMPVVAIGDDGAYFVGGPYAGFVDMQVFHPPLVKRHGRPDWLLRDPERRMVTIPEEVRMESGRGLLQAYYEGETGETIPADQLVLYQGGERPKLSLRPGAYRLVLQGEDGAAVIPGLALNVP